MSEASGHRGLWTEAQYPGDAVRILMLKRGHGRAMVLGDVRIQRYDTSVKVGSFLPGDEECSPGDTPKVWPEKSEWFKSATYRADNQTDLADAEFDRYVQEAYADGWQNYNPESDNG